MSADKNNCKSTKMRIINQLVIDLLQETLSSQISASQGRTECATFLGAGENVAEPIL
jgi:hypothetical protein